MFHRPVTYRTTYRFRDIGVQGHPKFRELCEISLYLDWCYSVGSLHNRFHIWQLGRPNGVVAATVTFDDLDLLL